MKADALKEWVAKMQDQIWAYEFKEVQNNLFKGIELLGNLVELLPKDQIDKYNVFLKEIIDAVQKSDYLLLSDLLEYRLKSFIDLIDDEEKVHEK